MTRENRLQKDYLDAIEKRLHQRYKGVSNPRYSSETLQSGYAVGGQKISEDVAKTGGDVFMPRNDDIKLSPNLSPFRAYKSYNGNA